MAQVEFAPGAKGDTETLYSEALSWLPLADTVLPAHLLSGFKREMLYLTQNPQGHPGDSRQKVRSP